MAEQAGDTYLVARVVMLRDKRAFDRLVCKYQSRVRRFFLSQTLGDGQLSDDLAQDTFLKAYTGLSRFRGLSSFSTWLMRIACNVLYDYARAHRPSGDLDSAAALAARPQAADTALRMDIYDALARLAPPERTCITLQLIDGQSIDKIAAITSMPEGTVKSHLSRGKAKLAEYLKKNGYER